mmetsp:Transcript_3645/g.6421  ORF Transcript_3645/g.6421 Transcript_3645/m.6421 type:complete len:425 (-) Transcript_3645:163-1437(-)
MAVMKLKKIRQQLEGANPPKEVRLRGFSDTDDEMDAFIAGLQTAGVRSIFFSTDFLNQMDEENVLKFFQALGDQVTTLEELQIQSSSRFHIEIIPPEALLPLRHAQNLKRVEFQDMQVTASSKAFIHALAKSMENHPSVETILLPNFFANDFTNTDPYVLDVLLTACATMPTLQTVELTGCGSHALSGQAVQLVSTRALTELLSLSRTLTRLQLSFLELEDDHFEALVTLLPRNTTLTSLALDYHNLGSRGFKSMMLAMEDNTAIKSLSLRSLRDIGLDGFAQVMLMLQYNYTVETLSVTASPSQQAEIDLYLRMNSAGRGLLRNPTATMNEWVEILARHSDDLDVVRHLLQEVPGLCNAAAFAASERRRRSSIAGGSGYVTSSATTTTDAGIAATKATSASNNTSLSSSGLEPQQHAQTAVMA